MPGTRPDDPPDFALDAVLLVDDVEDPRWQRLHRPRLTMDERAYDEALVPFLADLARGNGHIARGLASRVDRLMYPGTVTIDTTVEEEALKEDWRGADFLARGLLDRAGPTLPEDVRERLSRIASQPMPKD